LAVRDKGGIENLLAVLPVELRASELKSLGIMVDANSSLAGRWHQISQVLRNQGYLVPPAPDPTGTLLVQEDRPAVGVWLMPDNRVGGTLEDFARLLIPGGDPLLDQAGNCVDSIPQEQRRFPPQNRPKAVIHTWLAWQEEPGQPMGLAITKKFLRADSASGLAFVEWVRRLLAA
jgi:hypothetical protein